MNTTLHTSGVPFHVGVALQSTGFHPASGADPEDRRNIFSPNYWAELTASAERSGASFVTFEDSLGFRDYGQFDASLVASWVAPRTSSIGLIPTLTVTHTEPFHLSKNVATLDHISLGRAGWQVQVSSTEEESRLFGRGRNQLDETSLYSEAEEVVEVVRRLWDSWEDDAEIRDVATGRFIDRDKLHYIDYVGQRFSVKGPSITPRPPQGQPLVAFSGRSAAELRAAVRTGDVLFVPVVDEQDATQLLSAIRQLETELGRKEPLRVFADVPLLLAATQEAARQRWETLNIQNPAWLNADRWRALGTAQRVSEHIGRLKTLGFNGVRLQPAQNAQDIPSIEEELAPRLRTDDIVAPQPAHAQPTLRDRLDLPKPANRYATNDTPVGALR